MFFFHQFKELPKIDQEKSIISDFFSEKIRFDKNFANSAKKQQQQKCYHHRIPKIDPNNSVENHNSIPFLSFQLQYDYVKTGAQKISDRVESILLITY